VLDGSVRVRVEIEPRGGASAHVAAGGLAVEAWRRPDLDLHVRCNRPLESLHTGHELHAGDRLDVVLSWGDVHRYHRFSDEELERERGPSDQGGLRPVVVEPEIPISRSSWSGCVTASSRSESW
jgi:hypothetical protein